ncbi:MAG: transposase [Puniceicoccales bacterium]|nr:transposase [Puniceicoccales bacterium]
MSVAAPENDRIFPYRRRCCTSGIFCVSNGIAIGGKEYCSQSLRERLLKRGLRFIAHGRRNMKVGNTNEEKTLLRRRNLVES